MMGIVESAGKLREITNVSFIYQDNGINMLAVHGVGAPGILP